MAYDAPGASRLYLFDDGNDLVVAADRDEVRTILCGEFPCFEESDSDTPEHFAAFRIVPDSEMITISVEDADDATETRAAAAWVAHVGRGLLYSRAWDLDDECPECLALPSEPHAADCLRGTEG